MHPFDKAGPALALVVFAALVVYVGAAFLAAIRDHRYDRSESAEKLRALGRAGGNVLNLGGSSLVRPIHREPPPASVSVAMGRVLAGIPAIGKTDKAPDNMGGYSFRGIEAILSAVGPVMAAHGVFCVPMVIERLEGERKLRSGSTQYVVDLHVGWTFYGPAGDTIQADAWGEGTDMGDKATQKAMTSAFKSMLMQTFAIGDSATDSERHEAPETTGPTRRANPSGNGRRKRSPPPLAASRPKTDGWADAATEAEAHRTLAERIKELSDRQRESLSEHRDKYGWPMPVGSFNELVRLVEICEAEKVALTIECVFCRQPLFPSEAVTGQMDGLYHDECRMEEEEVRPAPMP